MYVRFLGLVRSIIALLSVIVLAACNTPSGSGFETVRIENALERRVTVEEARHKWLRDGLSSRLESFLSGAQEGDELWLYRTYVTTDRRGGETGLALVRGGRVVNHVVHLIID
jgi:predicted small secreted protein